MNQEDVKKKLGEIHAPAFDYTVTFSGKHSKRVNGLYKPDKKEIILHNKNFENDNLLIYTAIHELAHHICITEKGQRGARSHTALFWSTFHDLLDRAERQGVYTRVHNKNLDALIQKARELDKKIAELQRELGEVLIEINGTCEKDGIRAEDVFERDINLSRKTCNYSIKAATINVKENCGQDIQKLLTGNKKADTKNFIEGQYNEHKSVAQIQQGIQSIKMKELSARDRLIREKKCIEKTIISLEKRLLSITEEIEKESSEETGIKKTADMKFRGGNGT
jgi:hypothetical protein